jgi:hypothetical protein
MRKLIYMLAAAVLLPVTAMASTITTTDTITSSGTGSVSYTYFTLDEAGTTSLETFTDSFDSMLYLFSDDGSLDTSDFIAYDDDDGTSSIYGWYNSYISLYLSAGDYIAAVADYYLSTDEAISGINDSSSLGYGSGDYALTITSTANVSTSVPEPSTMILLGLGLFGMGAARRRSAK